MNININLIELYKYVKMSHLLYCRTWGSTSLFYTSGLGLLYSNN